MFLGAGSMVSRVYESAWTSDNNLGKEVFGTGNSSTMLSSEKQILASDLIFEIVYIKVMKEVGLVRSFGLILSLSLKQYRIIAKDLYHSWMQSSPKVLQVKYLGLVFKAFSISNENI